MEEFVYLCKISDIQNNRKKIYLDDLDMEIVIIIDKGKYYVIDNVCPHQHRNILCDGYVSDGYIYCPAHSWEFNLDTGKRKSGNKGIISYEVKIENDAIYAKIIPKKFNW